MLYVNKVMVVVRVTADLDPTATTKKGWKIAKAKAIVCKPGKKDETGNWVNDENPCWIDVKAFQKADDTWGAVTNLEKAEKGSVLYVEGELALETWDDKQTGQKRSKHVITANKIQFVEAARSGGDEGQPAGFAALGGNKGQQSRQYAPAGGRQQTFGGSVEPDPF